MVVSKNGSYMEQVTKEEFLELIGVVRDLTKLVSTLQKELEQQQRVLLAAIGRPEDYRYPE